MSHYKILGTNLSQKGLDKAVSMNRNRLRLVTETCTSSATTLTQLKTILAVDSRNSLGIALLTNSIYETIFFISVKS